MPPVGSVLFIGVANTSIRKVVRPLLPLFIAMIVALLIVTYMPALSLWLPEVLGYGVRNVGEALKNDFGDRINYRRFVSIVFFVNLGLELSFMRKYCLFHKIYFQIVLKSFHFRVWHF